MIKVQIKISTENAAVFYAFLLSMRSDSQENKCHTIVDKYQKNEKRSNNSLRNIDYI
jgi:hypothetical protein